VLIRLKSTISSHWNEFAQSLWIFAISHKIGGFAYFQLKCGGFLELTRVVQMARRAATGALWAAKTGSGRGRGFCDVERMRAVILGVRLASSICTPDDPAYPYSKVRILAKPRCGMGFLVGRVRVLCAFLVFLRTCDSPSSVNDAASWCSRRSFNYRHSWRLDVSASDCMSLLLFGHGIISCVCLWSLMSCLLEVSVPVSAPRW
jgi:hypothetical protein